MKFPNLRLDLHMHLVAALLPLSCHSDVGQIHLHRGPPPSAARSWCRRLPLASRASWAAFPQTCQELSHSRLAGKAGGQLERSLCVPQAFLLSRRMVAALLCQACSRPVRVQQPDLMDTKSLGLSVVAAVHPRSLVVAQHQRTSFLPRPLCEQSFDRVVGPMGHSLAQTTALS